MGSGNNDRESIPNKKLDAEPEIANILDIPLVEHAKEEKGKEITEPSKPWHGMRTLEIEKPDS